MMARMPDLSRRAILRLGVGAAAGAAGAYALGSTLSRAVRQPAARRDDGHRRTAGAAAPRRPWSPPTAAPTYVTGSFVSAARGGVDDQLGDRPAARSDRAAATGDRAARQGQRRRGR